MFDLSELFTNTHHGHELPPGFSEFARRATERPVQAGCSALQAMASYHRLQIDEALRLAERSTAIYATVDWDCLTPSDRQTHAQLYWSATTTRGLVLDDLKKVDETIACHLSALAIAKRFDYKRGILLSSSNLGIQYLFAGRTTEAVFSMLNPSADFGEYEQIMVWITQEFMSYVFVGSGLRPQAAEQLRGVVNDSFNTPSIDRRMRVVDLALMEAWLGQTDQARTRIAQLLSTEGPDRTHRIEDAARIVQSILLAMDGNGDDAFELFNGVVGDHAQPVKYSELLLSDLAEIEILAALGRWDDVLARVKPPEAGGPNTYIAQMLEFQTKALVSLRRWKEALETCRKQEPFRRVYDLDPNRYAALAFAQESEGPAGSIRPEEPVGPTSGLHDMLAHDMRNRFNSVQLAVEMIHENLSSSDLVARLNQLEISVDSVQEVPNNVMAYMAGLDRSATPVAAEEQLSALVSSTVERFRLEARAKNIALTLIPSPNGTVTVDREMLETCLSNLLGNAIKFTPMFGQVEVGWRFTTAEGLDSTQSVVEIFVDDDGPGLTAEDLKHIFVAQHALSARPTCGESSTGIGLTIVARLAEAVGATVRAANRPGGGARFSISLEGFQVTGELGPSPKPSIRFPDRTASRGTVGAATNRGEPVIDLRDQPSTTNHRRLRVMVFDDDPFSRDTITEILSVVGAEVVGAETYDEAFSLVTGPNRFDLFLVDYMIDGEPVGLRFAELAKNLWPQARVIVASGHSLEVIQIEDLDRIEFLRKPLRVKQLQALVAGQTKTTCGLRARPEDAHDTYGTDAEAVTIQVLQEIAQGRRLSGPWSGHGSFKANPVWRIDSLIVASVEEQGKGNHAESLRLAIEAQELLETTGLTRPVEILWHLLDNLGTSYSHLDRHEQALQTHRQALLLSRNHEYGHGRARSTIRLAETFSALGQSENAVATLVEATDQTWRDRPARAKLFQALGLQLMNQAATELAVVQLRRSLQELSSLDFDEMKRTLRYLGLAYLEMEHYERFSLVINQLERIQRTAGLTPPELANLRSMHAAQSLYLGHPGEALIAATAALNALKSSTLNDLSRIAIITKIRALEELGQYQQVVDEWGDPETTARSARTQSAHRAIARSAEKTGAYEIAYRHEMLANDMRRNHNRGLPHLISLTKDLSKQNATGAGRTLQITGDSGLSNPIGLAQSIATIKDLTQTILVLVDNAREAANRGFPVRTGHLQFLTEQLGRVIMELGRTTLPKSVTRAV